MIVFFASCFDCLGGRAGAGLSTGLVTGGTSAKAVSEVSSCTAETVDCCETSLFRRRTQVATFMFNCWGRNVFLPDMNKSKKIIKHLNRYKKII